MHLARMQDWKERWCSKKRKWKGIIQMYMMTIIEGKGTVHHCLILQWSISLIGRLNQITILKEIIMNNHVKGKLMLWALDFIMTLTSAGRIFYRGYFCYFAPVLEQRHIRLRPKRVAFGLGCYPKPYLFITASVFIQPRPKTFKIKKKITKQRLPLQPHLPLHFSLAED